ncbi:MAG: lipoyl(octanoyl) transferase LipB [candidate division Zixibacteria bacterium]|nr:lipoyl(octanoyl) transferase LipB [candidate division Zixibacteria bacterium]
MADLAEARTTTSIIDWGLLPYLEAHSRQLAALTSRIAGPSGDTVFLVEHPHVYTYGRGSNFAELQAKRPFDSDMRVELVQVERGGGVTYHGPGQLVAYPIIDVRQKTGDLHRFLRWLEEVIIQTIAPWGLTGEHHPTHTGVWIEGRKIASIGIAVRQWISYHGLALNVSTDLRYFGAIHPCGLSPEVMTSMEQLTGRTIAMEDVRKEFVRVLRTLRAGVATEGMARRD